MASVSAELCGQAQFSVKHASTCAEIERTSRHCLTDRECRHTSKVVDYITDVSGIRVSHTGAEVAMHNPLRVQELHPQRDLADGCCDYGEVGPARILWPRPEPPTSHCILQGQDLGLSTADMHFGKPALAGKQRFNLQLLLAGFESV